MKNKKTQAVLTVIDDMILLIQLIVTVVFSYIIERVLPLKYWFLVIVLLMAAMLVSFFKLRKYGKQQIQLEGKKRAVSIQKKKFVLRICSSLLSMILILGCFFAGKGLGALDRIAGEKYQTHLISVIVREESNYQTLQDLSGQTLGWIPNLDEKNMEEILDKIENAEKTQVETKGYDSVLNLVEALLNEKIEAILLNEAYRGLIEDEYPSFDKDTRILCSFEIQEELQRTDSDVNVTKESFNIYISGIDTYGKVSTVSRSDVNMIVTVNPTTKEILMTSIPRDYYVELASFGVKDKLTHAGIYGVEESMATLEKEFNISLDYYARVNFTSLITMVDALGGITVKNDQAFTSFHTHDYYPEGEIDMDGETALEFVRERYGLANGDHDRVKNQQKVLIAMLKKAMSPAIITNYSQLLDAASGSLTTNMSAEDIQGLIQMQLDDMASWNMKQISVNGKGTRSTSCYSMPGQSVYVMEPDYETVKAAVDRINSVMKGK